MKRLCWVAVAAVVFGGLGQLSASPVPVGHWPLNDGSGDIAHNQIPSDGTGFVGAPGIITNADTGGAHPTEADGLASVWVPATDPRAADFPLGPRTVWSTGGQGARGAPNTRNADTNPDGLTPRDTAFIEAGRIPKMTYDNDFTWIYWAKTDEKIASRPGQFSGIVGNRYADQDPDTPGREAYDPLQFIKFTPQGFEYFYDFNTSFKYNQDSNGDPTDLNNIPEGEWHHHAIVKREDRMTYYRDGQRWNATEITVEMDYDFPFFMGGDDAFDDAEQWHGFLSDVAIYDSALSQADIQDIVAGTPIVPEPSSVALALIGMMMGVAQLRRRK